ncbi:MAG: hypothetical protein WD851_17260 [Pirellulales bacterium]
MMSNERREELATTDRSACNEDNESLESAELAQLTDPEKQAEYRREYLAQLKRRACPGCGESDDLF